MKPATQRAARRLLTTISTPKTGGEAPEVGRSAKLATALQGVIAVLTVDAMRQEPETVPGSTITMALASTIGWLYARQPEETREAAMRFLFMQALDAAKEHAAQDEDGALTIQ